MLSLGPLRFYKFFGSVIPAVLKRESRKKDWILRSSRRMTTIGIEFAIDKGKDERR